MPFLKWEGCITIMRGAPRESPSVAHTNRPVRVLALETFYHRLIGDAFLASEELEKLFDRSFELTLRAIPHFPYRGDIDTRQPPIAPYARQLFVSQTLSIDLDREAFWS